MKYLCAMYEYIHHSKSENYDFDLLTFENQKQLNGPFSPIYNAETTHQSNF